MSKKLKMTALLAVLIVILVLAIGLVACDPKTNTYKVTTQFNAEQGDVTLVPEAKDGIYNEGTMVTVSVTAKSGYEFDALTVNTDANAALNNEGKYIFKVTADTQITVLFRSVAPAACEHKNLSALVEGKAATCMEAGVIAHYHCNDCGKDLAEDKTTILESTVINIDPTAHKYGEIQQKQDATCGKDGVKEHKDCTLCGKHFSADNVEIPDNELTIPATGQHKYDKFVNVGNENGHEIHCSVCDAKKPGEVSAHTYEGYKQDAAQGHHQECKECGYHTSIVGHTNKDAQYTFVDNDMHSYQCDDCNYTVYDEHHYGAWINDSAKGEHYHACQECKNEKDRGVHTFAQGATYTNKGEQGHTVECETCHEQIESAHQTTLTYDSDGHYTKCNLCDYRTQSTTHTLKYKQEYRSDLDKFNHQNTLVHYQYCTDNCGYADLENAEKCIGEWKTTDEEHWRECTVCHIIFQNYPKTRHTIEQQHDSDNHWQGCNECGYVQGGEEGKQGHTYVGEWELIKPYPQKHGQRCSVCNFLGNQQDHVYTSETYKPTVGKEQTKHQKVCDYCHEVTGEEEEHVWDEETHTTDDGQWEYHICTKCKAESEHTHKVHTHQSADGAWLVENGQHYQLCKECSEKFNVHDPEYSLNDGWYEGEGVCEHSECNISIYTFDSATNTLTGYSGSYTKIKLPSSIGGVQVTTLGAKNATAKNSIFATKSITNVMLPDSITTINQYAFASSQLVEIDTNKVTNIGTMAFTSCSKLTKVTTNAATMGQGAFLNCTTLDTAILKENASIGKQMFYGCRAIKTVVIESTVVPTVASSNSTFSVSTFTVYYKFSKEVYDNGLNNMRDQNLLKATIKYYYESKPSTSGIEGVDDSDAWYYDADGQIKLWSDPA